MAASGAPPSGGGARAGPGLQGQRHRPLPTHSRARLARSVLVAAPCFAAAARVDAPARATRSNPGGPLARRRGHGRSRPAARGLSGPSKRSAAIGDGDSRARHPEPLAGHYPRRVRGAAPPAASRQVSATFPEGGHRGLRPVCWGCVGARETGYIRRLEVCGGPGERGAWGLAGPGTRQGDRGSNASSAPLHFQELRGRRLTVPLESRVERSWERVVARGVAVPGPSFFNINLLTSHPEPRGGMVRDVEEEIVPSRCR